MRDERRRRILYGVHGYGRGHAVRAQAVLPELTRRHDVLILAGDEAHELLSREYPTIRVPVLRYRHGATGRRSVRATLAGNAPGVLDLVLRGPTFRRLRRRVKGFAPDVAISDSECWTHQVARSLNVPRIGFDHYGIMAYCRLDMSPGERIVCELESLVYRLIVWRPDRVVVTAFYAGRARRPFVRVVGPVLRKEVRSAAPSEGAHLLAYFSNPSANFTPAVEAALREAQVPVKVYGPKRSGTDGNLEFCSIGKETFLGDLAAARAVVATAGNQLISEAIHFGKPLLLLPEESLEQRLNARYVERWRIGMQTTPRTMTPGVLREFLARRKEFAANVGPRRRDGLTEAIDAIERSVRELAASDRER